MYEDRQQDTKNLIIARKVYWPIAAHFMYHTFDDRTKTIFYTKQIKDE